MDYMSDDIAEALDLIVEGRGREAYEKFRDVYPSLPSWDARTSLIAARKAPQQRPFPTEAEIDARHDRAIASFKPTKQRHGLVMEYPE